MYRMVMLYFRTDKNVYVFVVVKARKCGRVAVLSAGMEKCS